MTSRSRFALSLASTALVLYLASGPLMRKALGDTGYTQLSIFHEVVSMIRETYVDPVNMDRTFDAAESGLLEALDGDSGYLNAADFKELQTGKRGMADVGIVLGRRFGFLTVVATRPGSPARKAGIKAGDFIKFIDGKHTHGLTVIKGERLLSGEPGSPVKVAIFKSGTEATETALVRERPTAGLPVARVLEGGVGYLAVSDLGDGALGSVKAAMADLEAQGA
jgi:carboxyl-terminal processing protease